MQLRQLPAIHKLLNAPELEPLLERHGLGAVKETLRQWQARWRHDGEVPAWAADRVQCAARLNAQLAGHSYQPVHNMTGTVIHTNLGRAPLSGELWDAVRPLVTGSMNLEYDVADGRRGSREGAVERRLVRLTGAEAATLVNNNAGALLLVLNTLALAKPVPVSRGELVEIGGSFRLPDLMQRSGCQLLEVGTTNRTHLQDFAAVADQAACFLKVHPSNYAVTGFASEVGTAELAKLAQQRRIPLCVDLGSGALVNLARLGLPHEPMPQKVLKDGADLVTFSGDKLMGGVQAGLIVGRADLIARLETNPLKRALRLDKIALALLNEILKLYEDPDRLTEALPVLRMLTTPLAALENRADAVQRVLASKLEAYRIEAKPSAAQIGSGALPNQPIESRALAIGHRDGARVGLLAQRLRQLNEPVIGRIQHQALWLDMRSVVNFDRALRSLEALPSK